MSEGEKKASIIRSKSLVNMNSITQPLSDFSNKYTVATLRKAEFFNEEVPSESSTLLFEISTELACRSGSLYSLLRSKSVKTVSDWGSRYCLLGPYNQKIAQNEFEFLPMDPLFESVCRTLEEKYGMRIYYGHWLADGFPKALLFDINTHWDSLPAFKKEIKQSLKIAVPSGFLDNETNEVIIFGFQIFRFFAEFYQQNMSHPIVAHFHGWLASVAIPLLRQSAIPIALVYTAHGTVLGQTMATFPMPLEAPTSSNPNAEAKNTGSLQENPGVVEEADSNQQRAHVLFRERGCSPSAHEGSTQQVRMLETESEQMFGFRSFWDSLRSNSFKAENEARALNILYKHRLELLAVHSAHVLTTPSALTSFELASVHGRSADRILPTGCDVKLYRNLAPHEYINQRKESRRTIENFVRAHFHGMLNFEVEKCIFVFSAGRNDFRGKGYDVFIESLARLNYLLRSDPNNDKTVIGFLVTRGKCDGFSVESLKGTTLVKSLKQQCDLLQNRMSDRIFETLSSGKMPDLESLLSENELIDLQRRILTLKRTALPSVTTHNIIDPQNDLILSQIRKVGLMNDKNDPVKIIYHPDFLSAVSPVLPLDYHDFVRGCDLGVFCGYYDPWGSAISDCFMLGTPLVTSNLTGFGDFFQRNVENRRAHGVSVIDRRASSTKAAMDSLVSELLRHVAMTHQQWVQLRNATVAAVQKLSWDDFSGEYECAQQQALLVLATSLRRQQPKSAGAEREKPLESSGNSSAKEDEGCSSGYNSEALEESFHRLNLTNLAEKSNPTGSISTPAATPSAPPQAQTETVKAN